MDLDFLFHQYGGELHATRPHGTARAYVTSAVQLLDFLGKRDLDAEALVAYHRWLNTRGYARSTIRSRLAGTSVFLAWLARRGHIPDLALDKHVEESARLLMRANRHQSIRVPVRGHVDKVMAAAKQLPVLRDRALMEFLLSSGCRRAEVVGLDIGDLDLEDGSAEVLGKGDKKRRVYFSPLAGELIAKYLASRGHPTRSEPVFCRHTKRGLPAPRPKRLSVQGLYLIVQSTCKLAGLDPHDFTPHAARHAFAIRMLEETGDLAIVQDLLGHEDPRTTRVYATIYPERLKAAHRKVFK